MYCGFGFRILVPMLSIAAATGVLRRNQKHTTALEHSKEERLEKADFAPAIRWSGADQKRVKVVDIHLYPFFRVKIVRPEVITTGSEAGIDRRSEQVHPFSRSREEE